MKRIFRRIGLFTLFGSLTAALTACTGSDAPKGSNTGNSSSDSKDRIFTVQKSQGINVGEANSIWTVGMLPGDLTSGLILNVERISLTAGENFRKMAWTIPITGNLGISGTGSRTFLSEWGFLVGRGSNTGGSVGLFVVDHISNKWEKIFEAANGSAGTRATPFSYKVRGTDGKDYNFVALAYHEVGTNIRIERFLVKEGVSDLALRFARMKPYSAPQGSLTSAATVYSGFLYPNCAADGCKPIFYGNIQTQQQLQGFDLTADVPPTPFDGSTMATALRDYPNKNFVSTSHPPAGGAFGSVNSEVYSLAGDPNDGYIFLASEQGNLGNNSHVAYDRTNEVVFRVGRFSKIGPLGLNDANTPAPIVTVWKRECFISEPNCDPLTTTKSRVFSDVGESIGPASDLGNGCIAILGWRRPGEVGGNDFVAGVYTACIRDPNNLDKGLAVTKVGDIRGATYMYNDFTGAYQADKPITVLFDLSDKKIAGMKTVRILWVPKIGFSNNLTGLTVEYRCYAKAQSATPPPFKPYPSFPAALTMTDVPNCSGPTTNQIEFRLTRIPKQRFTRFDSITVTGVPF